MSTCQKYTNILLYAHIQSPIILNIYVHGCKWQGLGYSYVSQCFHKKIENNNTNIQDIRTF